MLPLICAAVFAAVLIMAGAGLLGVAVLASED